MKKLITIKLLLFSLLMKAQLNSIDISKIADKSVVKIETYDYFNNLIGQGSGVIISTDGKILTNYHVFKGGNYIVVSNGQNTTRCNQIILQDINRDFIIFRLDNNPFIAINIGNSDLLQKGEDVYAVGSPLGYENTISKGIISSLSRYLTLEDKISYKFIQHDAAISQGSSGGALLNNKGELIGINTRQETNGQNINFAIPINDIIQNLKTPNSEKPKSYATDIPKSAYTTVRQG
jgi:serine protease Do